MSRTVTALYDSRAEAEAARQRLPSALDLGSARIIEQSADLDEVHMSADDRHVYREGIRRGAIVLTAEVRSHEDADRIIRILEESASFDVDARQEEWRRDGWSSSLAAASPRQADRLPRASAGMRETDRGGGRVRSYLRDSSPAYSVDVRAAHPAADRRPADLSPGSPVTTPEHVHTGISAAGSQFAGHGPDRSGPSRAVVISSAIVGSVLGGVIGGIVPFLLADENPPRDRHRARRDRPSSRPRASGPVTVPVTEDGRVRIIRA